MNEPGKNILTRRHALPNLVRFFLPLVRPKMLRRYFFVLASLATLIALFYAEEDLRGKHAWESYMRQSKQQGIDLDWHAYVPAPVADEQNFAMTPPFEGMFDYEWTADKPHWRDTNIWSRLQRISLESSPGMPKLGDWVLGRALDLKKWQNYFRSGKFPETNNWPRPDQPEEPAHDVLLALSKLDPDLAAFRKASARPQSRFPVHYDELPKAMLVHLAFLRNVARILQLRAVAELKSGSNQEAFADVNLAFYCADAIKSEAFMISQIVRYRMMEEDLQPIWEGLGAHRWSEDQLKEFERYFARTDLLSRYDQCAKADLALTCGWIELLPDDPFSFSLMDGKASPGGFMEAMMGGHLLPGGWFYQNELSAARFFHEDFLPDVAPQTQRVYPGLSQTNLALFDKIPSTPYSFAFKQLASVISPQGFVQTQTEINLALVVCALERYRMARGHFPETLDGLAPEFLEKMPHDIINGEPLKYRLTGPGKFILYSVGWNEKDDGGAYPGADAPKALGFRDLAKYHSETGDWVWQYPN
jgi:hypothetical protein